MRYSYEFKLECVHLYKETGAYPPIPERVKPDSFKYKVRYWTRLYDQHGAQILKHFNKYRNWTPEDKLLLVNKCKSGKSLTSVAVEAGINEGQLHSWIRKYEELGYNGLIDSKKGRPSKNPDMNKKAIKQRELNESELEELIRLRTENEYIKTEIEVLKKSIALRQ